MPILGFGEPSSATVIIFLGAWINRDFTTPIARSSHDSYDLVVEDVGHEIALDSSRLKDGSLESRMHWRPRELSLLGMKKTIQTPNTAIFRDRILSRVLVRFPFLVEIVYWALIYGAYQFGRGQLAIRLVDQTIDVSCTHALAVVRLEQRLHIFWELKLQQVFLQHPSWMWWINRTYSYVHLPATITFLVGLYYFAITRNRASNPHERAFRPELYESPRRALALCNLFAFCVFSTWPCMPPRLLGDTKLEGEAGELARSFGFVDTIHARDGAVSVFNTKKWTNQLAAMPSLHFGYALLIGISLMRLPVSEAPSLRCQRFAAIQIPFPMLRLPTTTGIAPPPLAKVVCEVIGFLYPVAILVAIIATANHFILDAVAGGVICLVALRFNHVMKNLLPLEDFVLWHLRVHKPVHHHGSSGLGVRGFHTDNDNDDDKL